MSESQTLTSSDVGALDLRPEKPASPTRLAAQKRYAELTEQKAALVEAIRPYREDYERLANDARLLQCRDAIKQSNAVLGPIDNELAELTKILGGRRMSEGA